MCTIMLCIITHTLEILITCSKFRYLISRRGISNLLYSTPNNLSTFFSYRFMHRRVSLLRLGQSIMYRLSKQRPIRIDAVDNNSKQRSVRDDAISVRAPEAKNRFQETPNKQRTEQNIEAIICSESSCKPIPTMQLMVASYLTTCRAILEYHCCETSPSPAKRKLFDVKYMLSIQPATPGKSYSQ